jgi:DNA-binding MarR family transcriptional regulator
MKKNKENLLIGDLILLTFRLNGLFMKAGDSITKPAGQTSARWQVMGSIYIEESTVPQIARRIGITRQSVQRVADVLVSENIAKYFENIEHKRSKLLKLTSKGKKVMESIQMEQISWANKIGQEIGSNSLEKAIRELEKIEKIVLPNVDF